ncbi:MAG: tRNA 2-thiouridine(34) synthase MnmA [Nanoarchaeota archaeon]
MRKSGKIVLGMSGGVDSSVAAFLLQKRGYEVVGVFMKSYSGSFNNTMGECNWKEDYREAKRIAIKLGIKLYLADYEKEYREKVIDKMYEDYKKGLTPNPDILCNKVIKFPVLFEQMKKLGASKIATGHYARIVENRGKFCLKMAKDKGRDQSYFIYDLNSEYLDKIIFPIGDLTKEEVRKIALENGFQNWNRKGTRGICFVGKMDMKDFLRKEIKKKEGRILFENGKEIGKHIGSFYFTIGERFRESYGEIDRSKIGKEGNKKLYVAEKRKNNDLILVTEGSDLLKKTKVFVKDLHLIDDKEKVFNKTFKARVRHLGEMHTGKMLKENGKIIFKFTRKAKDLAEAQHIVFYDKQRVVGGGEMRFS